jgi:flagellar capping protein FliD
MSIKLKNRGEFEDLQAGQAGNMTVASISTFVIPFPCILKAVLARLGTAGTTGTSNTDIRKNGTSIFASGATAIQFATTSTTPTYGAVAATNPPVFAKGDVVNVQNTVIHTTPGVNLSIALVFQRLRGTGPVAQLLTDTLGPENE